MAATVSVIIDDLPRRPASACRASSTVVTHRRRCGKPTCRCAAGEALHESTVLSYSDAGRTRFVMLPAGEVAAVRAAVERCSAARATLDAQAETGRAALIARLGAARGNR
jgi:hypothetical protein